MPELGSAYYRLSTDPSAFNAGLTAAEARANTSAAKISRSFKRIGRNMNKVGHSMTKIFTVPALAIGGAAVYMNLKFEEALTKIDALVGASAAQMKIYRDGILALGRDSVVGPQKLAESLYFITSSGFKGAAAMRVLTAVNKAANAGMDDVSATADLLTSAINVYGKKALSAADATDILLAGVREGKAEPNALAASMGRVLGVAQALKIPFDDLTGVVASFTLKGYSADEAVTAVRGALRVLIKPASTAKDALEKVGLSIGELRTMVKKKGIAETLITMRNAFKGNASEMAKVIPNSSTLSAILSVTAGNGKQLMKVMNGVRDSTGAAGEAAKEAAKDPMTQMKKAWSSIRVDLIELGAILVPFVAQMVEHISRLAKWFSGLSDRWKKVILIAVLFLAVMGPLLIIVGSLITAIGVIAGVIGATGGIILLCVAAVGLLVLGFVILYKKFAFVRKHWQLFMLALGLFPILIVTIVKFVLRNWDKIVEATTSAFNTVKDTIIGVVTTIWDTIRTVFNAVISFFRSWGLLIVTIILLPFLIVLKIVSEIMWRIYNIVRAVWMRVRGVIMTAIRVIWAGITRYVNLWKAVISRVMGVIRSVVTAAWGFIRTYIIGAIRAVASAIAGPLGQILSKVKSIFGRIASFLGGWVSKAAGVAGRIGSAIYDGIYDALSGLASALGGIARSAINAVIGAFNSIADFTVKMPGPVPDIHVNFPDIPYVARGGITKGPTLAGIGEKGREAVLPLENNRGVDFMAKAMDRSRRFRPGEGGMDLRGLSISGKLNVATGELKGMIIDHIEAHEAWKEQHG